MLGVLGTRCGRAIYNFADAQSAPPVRNRRHGGRERVEVAELIPSASRRGCTCICKVGDRDRADGEALVEGAMQLRIQAAVARM